MPIDTRFPTWMLPQSSPMDALFKGVAAGSQIAANRYRNKALYAQAQEFQQQQDLREREIMAQNESRTLANEVHRTKLDHDAEDFSIMREWWPKYAAATGEELATLEPPNLHDKDRQQTVSTAISAKFTKEKQLEIAKGSAAYARVMAGGADLTTEEGVSQVYKLVGEYPFLADRIPWIEKARSERVEAKQKKETADAAIMARNRQLDLSEQRVQATVARADAYALSVDDRRELGDTANELRRLRLDPTTPYNAARIEELVHRHDAIAAKLGKSAPLSVSEKAQVSALSKSLSKVSESLIEPGLTPKKKAALEAQHDGIIAKLKQFDPPPPPPIAPVATNTGTQQGPPAPGVRVRHKATGQTGWWTGGPPTDEYEVIQ